MFIARQSADLALEWWMKGEYPYQSYGRVKRVDYQGFIVVWVGGMLWWGTHEIWSCDGEGWAADILTSGRRRDMRERSERWVWQVNLDSRWDAVLCFWGPKQAFGIQNVNETNRESQMVDGSGSEKDVDEWLIDWQRNWYLRWDVTGWSQGRSEQREWALCMAKLWWDRAGWEVSICLWMGWEVEGNGGHSPHL